MKKTLLNKITGFILAVTFLVGSIPLTAATPDFPMTIYGQWNETARQELDDWLASAPPLEVLFILYYDAEDGIAEWFDSMPTWLRELMDDMSSWQRFWLEQTSIYIALIPIYIEIYEDIINRLEYLNETSNEPWQVILWEAYYAAFVDWFGDYFESLFFVTLEEEVAEIIEWAEWEGFESIDDVIDFMLIEIIDLEQWLAWELVELDLLILELLFDNMIDDLWFLFEENFDLFDDEIELYFQRLEILMEDKSTEQRRSYINEQLPLEIQTNLENIFAEYANDNIFMIVYGFTFDYALGQEIEYFTQHARYLFLPPSSPSYWANDYVIRARDVYDLMFSFWRLTLDFQGNVNGSMLFRLADNMLWNLYFDSIIPRSLVIRTSDALYGERFGSVTREQVIYDLFFVISAVLGYSSHELTAVEYFLENDILRGREDGNHQLNAFATLEETIIFVIRAYEHIRNNINN